MRRWTWWGMLGLSLVAVSAWVWLNARGGRHETVFEPPVRILEPAPMCPWREPEADLQHFFPGATAYETQTRILSGQRLELQQKLGRSPGADENSLQVHQVRRGTEFMGSVLTRRVKGEHGAIELVVAFDTDLHVKGVRLQRLREPASIAEAVEDAAWLGALVGKSPEADWQRGRGIPDVLPEARATADQLIEGVRSMAILLAAAEAKGQQHRH